VFDQKRELKQTSKYALTYSAFVFGLTQHIWSRLWRGGRFIPHFVSRLFLTLSDCMFFCILISFYNWIMCESYCYNNETNNCGSVIFRTMNTSNFYGTWSHAQNVSAPGPSHEESSDDSSADDGDSSFSEMNSHSSSSSLTDNEYTMNTVCLLQTREAK